MSKLGVTATQANCALQILSKKLEGIAKDEALAGLKSSVDTIREKEFIDHLATTVPALLREDVEKFKPRERAALRNGLRLYVRNAKAAAGTVTALGRTEWAETLVKEAEKLEASALPELEDQASLRLAAGA